MLEAMLAFIDTAIPSQRFVLAGYSYGDTWPVARPRAEQR
jgi:hypothetical protein